MFRKIEDFTKLYRNEIDGTTRLFAEITDANMGQAVADGHRTVAQIAWHIVVSIPEMMNRTGLGLASVDHESVPPTSARAIQDGYAKVSAELLHAVESSWTDATLDESDDMYGERWTRGQTLTAMLLHEVHHRAEIVVLLRQAGARVPGLFGPSKEEWLQFGMEPPAY